MNAASWWNASKRKSPALALAVGIWTFFVACGAVPRDYFYTLKPPAVAPASGKTPYVLGVEPFRSPEILRDDRVLYYTSPTAMNYYQHHRWGAPPATLVAEFTAEWLQASGIFSQVKMYPLREAVNFTLEGNVMSFEEVDADGGARVRLAVALSLLRDRDHKLLWSSQQRQERLLEAPGVDGVASALNSACAQALGEMLPSLIAQVEQEYKNSGK